eukprot:947640-Heterocapsa_arctica.AAC.1
MRLAKPSRNLIIGPEPTLRPRLGANSDSAGRIAAVFAAVFDCLADGGVARLVAVGARWPQRAGGQALRA